jgi:hypothetical protein
MRSLLLVALLLVPSTASAVTKTVYIRSSSPVGIENTLLALGTGAMRDLGGVNLKELDLHALLANKDAQVLAKVSNIGRTLRVWINEEEVDARVVTRYLELRDAIKRRQAGEDVSRLDVIKEGLDFSEASKNMTRIGEMIHGFIRGKGQEGNFSYAYAFSRGGMHINRYTFVEDDHLRLVTTLTGDIYPATMAKLAIDAWEQDDGTTSIYATLTASTNLGNRCCLVRRAVNRRMPGMLGSKLNTIEHRARQLGEAGESDLLGAIGVFIDLYSGR